MQFVNIVVHSVEDMNFRVHLQYEFTKLGLDDYLEVRRQHLLPNILTWRLSNKYSVCGMSVIVILSLLVSEM